MKKFLHTVFVRVIGVKLQRWWEKLKSNVDADDYDIWLLPSAFGICVLIVMVIHGCSPRSTHEQFLKSINTEFKK